MLNKIGIIGAGIGGLCLAQMLKSAGIEFDLYEADLSPTTRRQGYRLHLDADGVSALRTALPERLFTLMEATSMVPLNYTTIMNPDFSIRNRFVTDHYSKTDAHLEAGIATHLNVNRATLREVLLLGLEQHVHYGKKLLRYESSTESVLLHFADGSIEVCNILVGADGANSTVRRQRLPAAALMDSGARSIYGRISVSAARKVLPPFALADVFTAAADIRKLILGVGPVIFPMRPDLAAATLAPDFSLSPQDDYMGCIVAGRRELFGPDQEMRKMSSDGLQQLAADLVSSWPAQASSVIDVAEPGSFFFIEMASSVPTYVPPAENVTFLGDAIHTMTPSLGRGANVALRDAANLGRSILAIREAMKPTASILAEYENEMLHYGFTVVRQSAEMGAKLLGQDPLPA